MELNNTITIGDNLEALKRLPDESIDMIYIDPPFNTGKVQQRQQISTTKNQAGDRIGFQGERYLTVKGNVTGFNDQFDDYQGFLHPRLLEAHRILKPTGCMYFHIDYREVHYCKIHLDQIFGRDCFLNEIIWAYDYGAKPKQKWPPKHDNILLYVKNPDLFYFDDAEVERIPYMAPGMVTKEKAELGKKITDTWWHTIVPTNGAERQGYATQKPLGILRRMIKVSCPPDGIVVDFFAGAGSSGYAAHELGRRFWMVDSNIDAYSVMKRRFQDIPDINWIVSGFIPLDKLEVVGIDQHDF